MAQDGTGRRAGEAAIDQKRLVLPPTDPRRKGRLGGADPRLLGDGQDAPA